jgi:WD40 repeat protein
LWYDCCTDGSNIKVSFASPLVFAIVTDSGFLLLYDIMNNRPIVRIAAHAREATSLDWHPWRRNILATGGSDRTVKGRLLLLVIV